MGSPIDDLRSTVNDATAELADDAIATPTLERPRKAGFGDYSTNEPIMDGTASVAYLLSALAIRDR